MSLSSADPVSPQVLPAKIDVLVVGGGPAGSTAACLLAEQGWQVALCEQAQHPRFHIGESLLPSNLPILERLGVLEQVQAMAVYKPGADFTCRDGTVQSFPFAHAYGDSPPHAYQVRRQDFDHLLLNNAAHKGVQVFQRHKVIACQEEEGVQHVQIENAAGEKHAMRARLVIDASGRAALTATRSGWQVKNRRHASAAIFAHFKGVARRSGALEGNISVYWFEHGWIWMIPLTDDVMSVGAVCSPEFLKTRDTDLEAFLRKILAGIRGAGERMVHSLLLGEVHATGNYSYQSREISAPGVILVGDAFAFIDPVFSSGVYLAMFGATRSIAPAQAWLRGDTHEFKRAIRQYRAEVESKINAFAWFIYRFTTPTMQELFENPRNDWQVEQAVISMLAGDGDAGADIRRRLRIFKTIYYLMSLKRGARMVFGSKNR